MPRNRKPSANGTAIATVEPPALPNVTRSEANRMLKARAQDLFHVARAQREERIRQFEGEYGRADRIDHTLLKDLQNLQVRFAAIAARQFKYANDSEPKVSKFTKQLGEVIGELSSHLATERALELFAPIEERDYLGVGGTIGRKGLDESVLAGYNIVDDPLGPRNLTPTTIDDEGEQVCLHDDVEPYDDNPASGACADCGEKFVLNDSRSAEDS